MAELAPPAAYAHNGQAVSAARFYALACDPARNVAVEACAGAGKTWMLVSRIVRALLAGACGTGPSGLPHEILAITFTRRAAAEMRERLHHWLFAFSSLDPQQLALELQMRGLTSGQASPAQCQALAGLHRRMLESGREVQIRTFHGWFAALLRVAPLAVLQRLQLPLTFELLEDDAQATALVWRGFYQALVDDPARRQDFENLVLTHGRAQTDKALSGALSKRTEFALADAGGVVEHSVTHFAAMFPALAAFDDPLDVLATPSARLRWLEWAQLLGQEGKATPRKAAGLIELAFALDGAGADGAVSLPEQRLAALRKALFVKDEDRLTAHLASFAAAQEAGAELAVLCAASHQHAAWLYQQRMVRLTRLLLHQYTELKQQRGWVDMTDVERCARVLLSDPVLSGWIQERLDAGVRHLLIDEFQDTNPLQWQALMSWLVSYSGAGDHAPSVFLVGDPKQSIYRFRRAEPQVFRAAQEFVRDGLGGELLSCDHTRRNAPEVIAAVNSTMTQTALAHRYTGFRWHTTDALAGGCVCSLPPIARAPRSRPGAPATESGADVWRDSLTEARPAPEDGLRDLEARPLARWVANEVAGAMEPGECIVLSRRRAGLLPLHDALREMGVPAVIGEKTALMDCCEVQDLVALIDVLVSPDHDLSLARVLKSPLFDVPDSALVALALRRRGGAVAWFELLAQPWPEHDVLHGIAAVLGRWQTWVRRLPPHDALQAIYQDGDVLAKFAAAAPRALRDVVLGNLRALLGAALEFDGGRYPSPYAFVRALKAPGVMAPARTATNAVRLLTIHGAKGLEADTVLIVDTDTAPRAADTMGVLVDWPGEAAAPQRLVFLASERRPPMCAAAALALELEQRQREELNALYVAMTRARRRLVVSSIEPHRDAPQSWWQLLVAAAPLALPQPAGTTRAPGSAALTTTGFELAELPAPGLAPSPGAKRCPAMPTSRASR